MESKRESLLKSLGAEFTNLTPEQETDLQPFENMLNQSSRSLSDLLLEKSDIITRLIEDTVNMEKTIFRLKNKWTTNHTELDKAADLLTKTRKELTETLKYVDKKEHNLMEVLKIVEQLGNQGDSKLKIDLILAKLTNIENCLVIE